MAKIDTISWGESSQEIINLTAPVGVHRSVNNYGDVMAVQALCKYICLNDNASQSNLGIHISECPEPNGTFDKATARLIIKLQAQQHKYVLQDGIIHPAKNHKYQWGSHKLWTIVLLNSLAQDRAFLNDDGDCD